MSCKKSLPNYPDKGGTFRVDDTAVKDMRLPAPVRLTVPSNTLVMVDTKGYHRRGLAPSGTVRRSLYTNFRPWAWMPIAY